MSSTIDRQPGKRLVSLEGSGWIACRVPQSAMNVVPVDLLERSATPQPGNLRYAISDEQVLLLGEIRSPGGTLSLEEAQERLLGSKSLASQNITPSELACFLGETGYEWSQPEGAPGCWKTVALDASDGRWELTAWIEGSGVEIKGRLAAWDAELSDASRAAIALFLAASHVRVRFARFVLQEREAMAVSFAAADRLDVELPDSLAAVVAACRDHWREVRALADRSVAEAYLEITRGAGTEKHVGRAGSARAFSTTSCRKEDHNDCLRQIDNDP